MTFLFLFILLFNNKYNTLQFFIVRQGKWANTCNPTHAQLQERENKPGPMLWDTSGTNEWIAESQPI